jgi:HSP20 family protein
MALIRWDPFRDLLSLQDRMNRIFEESVPHKRRLEETLAPGVWSPAVDIYEVEDAIVIKAELPGLTKEDISIEIKENALALRGERKFEKNIREENYHRIERSYGTFSRMFSLPATADTNSISAVFKDGILEITIPKTEEPKPRSIEITQE